jgi:hypothetical protein
MTFILVLLLWFCEEFREFFVMTSELDECHWLKFITFLCLLILLPEDITAFCLSL